LGLPWSCDACYDKASYPRRTHEGRAGGHAIAVRAGRHTNCGESFDGLKGATAGFSSIMNRRVKPMLSRSTTVRRVANCWSVRISGCRLGWGILQGVPALSCSALGEERYFCYPFGRCGLDPVTRTVSPRSGKDPSPLGSDPCLLSGRAAPTSHRASGLSLCPDPPP
jgi:hypothetical protein